MGVARAAAVLVATLVLTAGAAAAQDPPPDSLPPEREGLLVRGRVADVSTGRPIPAAAVRFFDLGADGVLAWQGLTDSLGVFRGPRLAPATYRIEADALGYDTVVHVEALSGWGTAEVVIDLSPTALELEPLVVVTRRQNRLERSGFYDRRERGFGVTLDRAEIEARRPRRVTDLLRTLPGVTVTVDGLGRVGVLRMRGGCVPDVVVDGMRMSNPVRLDDLLQVQDLEAVEVYSAGSSPIQFSRSSCGAILVWTRDPGERGGSPFSWKRLGIAAGVFLLGLLAIR